MGSFGVNKSKRKAHNYRFVPRPKKEQIPVSEALKAAEDIVQEPESKPVAKRKTADKPLKSEE